MKSYSLAEISWQFFKHYINAGNEHSIHSPFVFKFYTQVIKKARKPKPEFKAIGQLYKHLKQDKTPIKYIDPSSKIDKSQTIGHIAKTAAKSPHLGRVLGMSFAYFSPNNAIELGTSLGLSALYQTALFKPAKFISIDANSTLQSFAKKNIESLGINIIELKCGYFNEVLPQIALVDHMEWVFIDGDHQLEPTLAYFNYFVNRLPDNAVLVFDDINWSADMQKAWLEITQHPRVTVAIDFFYLGFVFLNPDCTKQTFKLRL